MKLQDLHPYDSAIVGLNNLYRVDYKGDFFINAPFIISPNKKISTGSTYVLIYAPHGKNKKVHLVGLIDAFDDDGTINLIVRDILSQETFTIDQQIECTGDHLKWVLIDFDFIVEEISTHIINSNYGTSADAKKKTVTESNHIKLNDDLFEFDF